VPPTPVRLTCRALERERRSPRRGDGRLLHARTGLRRDVRPAGPVTFVVIGPVRPSPPSQHHPGHCITISYTVGGRGDRRRHAGCCAPCGLPSAAPSKPFLDRYRTRCDVSPEARIARTVVYSTALYAIPPHVDKIVRHDCKLPPP
jgi:hypothetical protein